MVSLVPRKPKRPCSHPGCPELTEKRFCSEHARAEDTRYRNYQRDPKINRRYDHRWRKIRAAYVALPDELAGQLEGAFLPEPADQRYTRLGDRLWRYEGLFRDFVANLPVDDMGLVLDYPQLFRRVITGAAA